MFRRFGCFLIFALYSSGAFAGEYAVVSDSTVVGRNHGYPQGTPEPTAPGNLDLVTEAVFFSKNIETPDGRTFIGYFAPLRLRYRPGERVTLEAGAQLGHNFGDDDRLDATEPIFRLVFEPLPSVYLVAGTLVRTHTVHDALYDDANAFLMNVEQGLQMRADLSLLKQDTWINWKERETATRPEKFDFGSTTELRLGGLRLNGQLFWVHTGGQLNNPDNPVAHVVDHNINFMGGGSYGLGPVRIGGYYLYDKDIPDSDSGLGKSTGQGVEGMATVEAIASDDLDLSIFGAYFAGDDFFAKEGDPFYRKDEYSRGGANLLWRLPAGLRLEFGLTVQYFDGSFEHTEQLYLLWGRGFTLLKGL